MNAEAVITALNAYLNSSGNSPEDLMKRYEAAEVPNASGRALNQFKIKYALLGKAAAHKKFLDYVNSLKNSIDTNKTAKADAKDATEPVAEEFALRIDEIFKVINEETAVTSGNVVLAADKGILQIDGQTAISNHADILKALVNWLIANDRTEVLKSAIEGIGNNVRDGAIFRN